MSPILKRDVAEQLRQAKRLAGAISGASAPEDELSKISISKQLHGGVQGLGISGSNNRRVGIGVNEEIYSNNLNGGGLWRSDNGKGKEKSSDGGDDFGSDDDEARRVEVDGDGDGGSEDEHLGVLNPNGLNSPRVPNKMSMLEYEDEDGDLPPIRMNRLKDLREMLFESTPSLLLSLVGLVFTGELLEHLARWRVFRNVDELFILVPMIGNLKGNLEMCLSARLGTSANMGELDHRKTRRALILANMVLLGLQALLISFLAAIISFILGLLTIHRLGDDVLPSSSGVSNSTLSSTNPFDPGLAVGEQDFHEGYTRPGWKQLVMVLATGMASAGFSSAILGSFMSGLIVVSRWSGLDPDNITPPLAACLGDLLTLFILALIGSTLVGTMDTPIPLIAVLIMTVAAGWFTKRVMRNVWVKNVAKGGWLPLIGAMLISSGTGMVLDKGVGKYRGFALLAISMTGLTGAIGAIHANRLSTLLHLDLHPSSLNPRPLRFLKSHLSPLQAMTALYMISLPCQALFLLFVKWAGWIDLSLGWNGWLAFGSATAISLALAHFLTMFFWSRGLDPDSYTLPIQSALVDFIGQLLLMLAYEICIWQGEDVIVHDASVS